MKPSVFNIDSVRRSALSLSSSPALQNPQTLKRCSQNTGGDERKSESRRREGEEESINEPHDGEDISLIPLLTSPASVCSRVLN